MAAHERKRAQGVVEQPSHYNPVRASCAKREVRARQNACSTSLVLSVVPQSVLDPRGTSLEVHFLARNLRSLLVKQAQVPQFVHLEV